MDRRSFLKNTAIGGSAVAASTLAAPAYAQGRRTLTMVTSVPDGFAVFDDAAVKFIDMFNAMADGEVTIEKRAAGQLVGAFEVFDAVSSGQADMYHSADYYFGGQHPGYYYMTAVPFGATGGEMISWYQHGGGKELHDELGEIFNLKSFLCGNTGHQPGGWFNKEISSAADLQGLKFRMPGLGGLALGRTGASVQNIPGGEIYQALSSGAIDGAEWIGPFADERLGFQEVCEFYYTGGFHEPGSVLTRGVQPRCLGRTDTGPASIMQKQPRWRHTTGACHSPTTTTVLHCSVCRRRARRSCSSLTMFGMPSVVLRKRRWTSSWVTSFLHVSVQARKSRCCDLCLDVHLGQCVPATARAFQRALRR